MESGLVPAVLSLFFPGIGQALTDGKPTDRWIAVFVIYLVIAVAINFTLGMSMESIFSLIVGAFLAYDAYADVIDL